MLDYVIQLYVLQLVLYFPKHFYRHRPMMLTYPHPSVADGEQMAPT